MCGAATLAVNGTILVIFMVIIGLISMGVGGYVVKFFQESYDTTELTSEEFRKYSWEYSLYFTAAVEGAIVAVLVLLFLMCNAFDACWMCTQCCCTHFICTPLVHKCCLPNGRNHTQPDHYNHYDVLRQEMAEIRSNRRKVVDV